MQSLYHYSNKNLVPKSYTLAKLHKRFFASLMDDGIFTIIDLALIKIPFGPLISMIIRAPYFAISIASSQQCTPMQRLFGIYIIRTNGQKIDREFALNRFLIQQVIPLFRLCAVLLYLKHDMQVFAGLSMLLLIAFIICYAVAITDKESRTVYDKIMGTRIVIGQL